MRDFGHRIGGDDAEVYFYLYDGHPMRMRPLSERFLVNISKDGFSNYIEKLHSNCTVFTDLGAVDLNEDLYIVAVVMRVGKIIQSESVKKVEKSNGNCCTGGTSYRRPFGAGVLSLNDLWNYDSSVESEEREYNFKVSTHEQYVLMKL